ncbi:MAG TPA: enoyl-CoA hydratase/isomerase family protein [Solirubrobacteraceae bacterium]|nr:enoyl-CoA hydratase/isomerase family protein [Solirubrobacteraceae bacterium]
MAVTFTSEGPIAFITLEHPPANSYDLAFMTEFADAVDEALGDPTRVVIVQSASEKFFSAGADIKRFLEGDVEANMEMIRISQATFRQMAAASQVFIASIAGHALGGGLEIALACDIRLAAAGSYRLGLPEVTLGLLPGNGGTQRLTRMIGPSRALELILTGRTYGVEDARAFGLIADVYDAGEADAKVREYAERLAGGAVLAQTAIKRCVYEGGERTLEEGLALEGELMEALFRTQDSTEGLTAFVEKRKAEFVGT